MSLSTAQHFTVLYSCCVSGRSISTDTPSSEVLWVNETPLQVIKCWLFCAKPVCLQSRLLLYVMMLFFTLSHLDGPNADFLSILCQWFQKNMDQFENTVQGF